MGNETFRSVAQVEEDIRVTKKRLAKLEEELAFARKREYDDSLGRFLHKYGISSKEDLDRIDKIIEGVESVARQHVRPVKEKEQPKRYGFTIPDDEDKDGKAVKPVKPVPAVKDPGPVAENDPEAEEHPKKESDVIAEAPDQDDSDQDEEDFLPKWNDFSMEDDSGADESDENEEISHKEAGFMADPNETPKNDDLTGPFTGHDGEENGEEADNVEQNVKNIWDELDESLNVGNVLPSDMVSQMDYFSEGIDVSTVIASKSQNAYLNKFAEKPAVADAETKLVSAIGKAVEEGWVKKEDVLEVFFGDIILADKIISSAGANVMFYEECAKVMDRMHDLFEEHAEAASAKEFEEFFERPHYIKCKATALAQDGLRTAFAEN